MTMAEPLWYLLITANDIGLEKVTLGDMQHVITVFNTFTADGKYALLNRHNLTQSIQKPLS